MKSLEQIISPIAVELERFERSFEGALKSDTLPMDRVMRYVTDAKGKRLRPILVYLTAKLLGEINDVTHRTALFVEMIHTATLIHDDVVDASDTRRGQPSVNARWSNASAVLAGDYVLSKAILLLLNDQDILQEMMASTAAMSEGELIQNEMKVHPDWDETLYLEIITRKTAMLLRSCCVGGAISVGTCPDLLRPVANYGLNLGIVFQMRDDILDADDALSVRLAQKLLPVYLEKTLKALSALEPLARDHTAFDSLKALTDFCAVRES